MKKAYKKIVSALVLISICAITIGYSAFGSELSISNIVADVRIASDIRITSMVYSSYTGDGLSFYEDYSVKSLVCGGTLPNSNSSITYKIGVTNFGNVEMGIYDITGLPDNLDYEILDYTMQEKICDNNGKCSLGAIKYFYLTIKYKDGGYDSSNTEYEIRMDIDFREIHTITYDGITNNNYPTYIIDGGNLSFTATGTIPPKIIAFYSNNDRVDYDLYSYTNDFFTYNNVTSDIILKYHEKAYLTELSSDTYFKDSTYKTVIDSVKFVEYVDTTGAVVTYDLSESSGSKEIIGWITSENDLYIGSEWNIYSKNLNNIFGEMSAIQTISFENLNTNETTNMHYMFKDCSELTSLDVSSFNTSNVTNMGRMFQGLNKVTTLNVSGFDTSKVTNMNAMFNGMSSLTSLNVSNFNTSKTTVMAYMFYGINKVTTLDVSKFNTSKVTNMEAMFYGMSSLTSLDISNFDTSNVVYMGSMFQECEKLTQLNLSNFNTSKVTRMDSMFFRCSSLVSLDLDGFNTSNVTSMNSMFAQTKSLKDLDISSFDTSKVKDMTAMFSLATQLTSLDLSHFNTGEVQTMQSMFSHMTSLTSINLSSFDTSNVKSFSTMFYTTTSLTSLDVSNFDTSSATNMSSMFRNVAVSTIDVSNFDTSNVTDMSYMFRNLKITELDLTNFNTSNVTNMSYMFSNSTKLEKITVSNLWNTDKVTNNTDMFYDCGISELTFV